MDISTVIAVAGPLVTLAGGWSIGRRGLSRQTIDLLQIQVDALRTDNESKGKQIEVLQSKVDILESMVTQRAAVEEVRILVERIADRVGA